MANPYQRLLTELPNPDGGSFGSYYSLPALNDPRIDELPISIRYLLESAIRNCDNFQVMEKDIEKILDWANTSQHQVEIPFKPARVILQDFTGVPAVVDLAAMRDAMKESGGDPNAINPQVSVDLMIVLSVQVDYVGAFNAVPVDLVIGHSVQVDYGGVSNTLSLLRRLGVNSVLPALSLPPLPLPLLPPFPHQVPVDLVIDHSVQVDYAGASNALSLNMEREFERNRERFAFLKWGSKAFSNMLVVPPGAGIVHQVNLEYLARVVMDINGLLYPDSVVGTDSHTTMIDGLGVAGWGVNLEYLARVVMDINGLLYPDSVVGTDSHTTMIDGLGVAGWGVGGIEAEAVNLEYLARVVMDINGLLYPDSVVGTDSHTTMIDGLGVAGWGVGGIEAEAAMLGQAMSMVLPQVVGFKLTGKLQPGVTATDLVLTCTQMLRKHGVVGKFVEFYGEGTRELSLADRATVANMSPEYGATMGFFPVDSVTLQYLRVTGRDETKLKQIETYMRANNLFMDHTTAGEAEAKRKYSSYLELDLATVEPCVSGPKRPHDRVTLKTMKSDWHACLDNPVGFKGFAIPKAQQDKAVKVTLKEGVESELKHGSVVIAAITSCTNTSNPSVMLAAAIVAKKASERGLQVKPYVKTSLAPGSNVVTKYLEASGLLPALEGQGFHVVGYGCTTCIGNSGEIHEAVGQAIADNDLVAAAVLSGNRNFEGRVHPLTRANYLASPPLVVAYALAGTVDIDFETEPISTDKDGKEVFLRDIWPSKEEVAEVVERAVLPQFFQSVYKAVKEGATNALWNSLPAENEPLYRWEPFSTYIHDPPYFKNFPRDPPGGKDVKDAFCLLNVGDSITTDHISPAGSIHKDSPAARYLTERGVPRKDFNSYGSRRGNDEVMTRGTFANIRLVNKLAGGEVGPKTVHLPSGEKMSVFDAAMRYKAEGHPTIVLAGAEYGSGSSRDWAAKGPYLQGVRAVISVSFERIHRSNLVGMGIIPLCFKPGQNAETLGLTGKERFSFSLPPVDQIQPGQDVVVSTDNGKSFTCTLRFDTELEKAYYNHGGILHFVLRQLLAKSTAA
ncbi:unnamed protein product [Closterium sp. NIES-65]|nr:unnamed protein product [Closterium sp. NIES-65]